MTVLEGVVAPPQTLVERPPRLAPEDTGLRRRRLLADPAAWAVALALVVGLALHLYLLFHESVSGDEATVGQMAQQILHGHLGAFFWGQRYGGVEPYVVAVAFAVFGQSALMLKAVPMALSLVASVLTYGVARRATRRRRAAAAVAALVWVWPEVGLWNSTRESGFRMATLCCGLGSVLLTCRVADDVKRNDARRAATTAAALGLVAGVGWWASPEVVYYLVPAAVIVLGVGLRRRPRAAGRRRWVPIALAAAVPAAALGALPWIWDTASAGLGGLRFPSLGPRTTYAGRLGIFWREVAPLLLGLRREGSGAWVAPASVAAPLCVAFGAVVVAGVLLAALRPGLQRALALGVIAFPFLYAIPQRAGFWNDGRFGVYLMPMVGVTLGSLAVTVVRARQARATDRALTRAFVHPAGRLFEPDPDAPPRAVRRPGGSVRLVAALVLVGLTALSTAAFAQTYQGALPGPAAFFSGWRNPNDAVIGAVRTLRAHGVSVVYADYWVASVVGFVGAGDPQIVSFDTVRNVAQNRQGLAAAAPGRVAWLFYDPQRIRQDDAEFTALTVGPYDLSLHAFEADLARLRVPAVTIELGTLVAVIPTQTVAPQQVGVPGRFYLQTTT